MGTIAGRAKKEDGFVIEKKLADLRKIKRKRRTYQKSRKRKLQTSRKGRKLSD